VREGEGAEETPRFLDPVAPVLVLGRVTHTASLYSYFSQSINDAVIDYYLLRRLASEVVASRCHAVCLRRAAYMTYRLHAALVSSAKVMRCIQCSLVD